jgi:hypothetical protein
VVKAPKLHFLDSGLACHLLGIREPEQLRHHPLRGAIFASWVVSELYKSWVHRGASPDLFHYREARGVEIDVVREAGARLDAIEIKSAATLTTEFFQSLHRLADRLQAAGDRRTVNKYLVYGGETSQRRSDAAAIPWHDVYTLLR